MTAHFTGKIDTMLPSGFGIHEYNWIEIDNRSLDFPIDDVNQNYDIWI